MKRKYITIYNNLPETKEYSKQWVSNWNSKKGKYRSSSNLKYNDSFFEIVRTSTICKIIKLLQVRIMYRYWIASKWKYEKIRQGLSPERLLLHYDNAPAHSSAFRFQIWLSQLLAPQYENMDGRKKILFKQEGYYGNESLLCWMGPILLLRR